MTTKQKWTRRSSRQRINQQTDSRIRINIKEAMVTKTTNLTEEVSHIRNNFPIRKNSELFNQIKY
jgi:hypothetical protein